MSQQNNNNNDDNTNDILSYRAKFNETVTCLGIIVLDPTLMSTIVKTLQKLDGKVYLKKAFTPILDISTTLNHSTATITLPFPIASSNSTSAPSSASLPKGSRVVVMDPVGVPFPNETSNHQFSTMTVSSFFAHQQDKSVLEALAAVVDGANKTAKSKNQSTTDDDAAAATTATTAAPHAIDTLFALARVDVHLSYVNYTSVEILARLLPPSIVVPSGFEQVGHIVHLNLSAQQGPYKQLIARVILDCAPKNTIRTVINKTESISSEFRELPFELLGGDADYNATVKQHGITFLVPYDKVYWNSRLSHEHIRLVTEAMQTGDELLDVMAGVGPFAIPAASASLPVRLKAVYANDLNPASVDAMRKNAELNKIISKSSSSSTTSNNNNNANHKKEIIFETYCMDGRKFITDIGRDQHLNKGRLFFRNPNNHAATTTSPMIRSTSAGVADGGNNNNNSNNNNGPKTFRRHSLRHFVMNLPATAVLFLDAFTNQIKSDTNDNAWPEPLLIASRDDVHRKFLDATAAFDHTFVVHVYCFSAFSDQQQAINDAVNQAARVVKRPVGNDEQQRIQQIGDSNNSNCNNTANDDSAAFVSQNSCLVHKVHVVRDVAPNKLMVCVSFSPSIMAPPHLHDEIRREICCFDSSSSGSGVSGTRRDRETE